MLRLLLGKSESPQNNVKELRYFTKLVSEINALESWARDLKKEEFPQETKKLEEEYHKVSSIDVLLPQSFALIREAARRVLGERMFDVQLMGGIVLHQGRIAEMKTGEGKTLTSTSAAFLNSLTGDPVHMVTVNDYLAKRDAEWMRPVFEYLGKNTGYIVSNMPAEQRVEMYSSDIVYATNNELGFDYLRDNLRLDAKPVVRRGYHYCIIDEIDSVLIDEARTPLIISGPALDDTHKYKEANDVVHQLKECSKDPNTGAYPDDETLLDHDYKLDEKNKNITFTKKGIERIEQYLLKKGIITGSIEDMENFEYVHYVTQTMRAHKCFHIDVDYIINEKKVEIIDEFTGRVLSGRRYSDGLHQAIEAKENIRIERQNKTLASVTFQNFFRMYTKLSGMTGTAKTEEKEFNKIYGLDVFEVATNRPVIRDDRNDEIYINDEAKNSAIIQEIQDVHEKGQPILLGTASIENSEKLSRILTKNRIKHNVLNAKNHENEAYIIAEAGKKAAVTIATNMAGRGTDIKLGGNLDFRIQAKITDDLTEEERIQIREEEYQIWRQDYQEVLELGGLYVLGTERHESRRIDNQLRGRSGRQGDNGVSKFFLSLDDQLLRLFGQGLDRIRSLMTKALDSSQPLSHPLITNTMERAQKNVEARNFEVRKHLLNFDEVLNGQKNTIYKQREEILTSKSLIVRLNNNAKSIIEENAKENDEDALEKIKLYLHEQLLFNKNLDDCNSIEEVVSYVEEDLEEKANKVGTDLFNEIIRMEYLKTIDQQWQEHISQLEELRQAVYLRSYAQKNPLLEYKLESYEMFDEMIGNVSESIIKKFAAIRADSIHIQDKTHAPTNVTYQHQNFSAFSGENVAQNTARSQGRAVQVVRPTEKVGRNDLCPCGSGKKYKKCHGA